VRSLFFQNAITYDTDAWSELSPCFRAVTALEMRAYQQSGTTTTHDHFR
jgi:hypothetical protein